MREVERITRDILYNLHFGLEEGEVVCTRYE